MSPVPRRAGTPTPDGADVRVPAQTRSDEAAPSMDGALVAAPRAATPGAPGPANRGRRWRRRLSPLVSVAIVVGVFWFFLPQFTSLSEVGRALGSMTALSLGGLLLAGAWNLVTYWLVMVATMPGLRYREAAVVTEASTAVSNTLPGGGAIGVALSYEMFYSWGFSRSRASVALVVSGIFNNFAKLALPVLALALLALSGSPSGGRVVAGAVGIAALVGAVAVLGAMLHSAAFCAKVGIVGQSVATRVLRPFGKPPATGWDRATVKFRDRTVLLLRARWIWISATTLLSHLSLYLVLLLALRAVGVPNAEVGWIEVLAVYSFARLVTAVPLTPGGLGVVELALISGLAGAGGDRADVAAAVLLFRALTYVVPIPLGLATYLFWKRNTSWRRPPNAAPRTVLVPEAPVPLATPPLHPPDASATPPDGAAGAPVERPLDVGTAGAERLTLERDSSPGTGEIAPGPPGPSHALSYLVVAGIALVVIGLSALPISRTSVPDPEQSVFRFVNDRTFVPFLLVWPFMQLGNFLVIPVLGLFAAATRRFRLSATVLVGGSVVWLLAKLIKHQFERGRPPALLDDVHVNGPTTGLGYPSGHAAVAAALATVCWPYLGRRGRAVAAVLVLLVCLGRLWVGAHLPLDVVGGAALGVVVGALLLVLVPPRVRLTARVERP